MNARLSALALSLLALVACGSGSSDGTGGGDGGTGGSDGKYHPPGNGVAMSETDACAALSQATDTDSLALMCLATSVTCPDRLREEFTTPCLQYDQGSVQGCVAYYAAATTCTKLYAALDGCAVTPIAGSAPKGCP
jgi:hypothetical protein